MSDPTTGRKVKEVFENEFLHAFPLEDVAKLGTVDPNSWDLLHGNLDVYFSSIAGYASSADRLSHRSKAELVQAREYLSRSFFERHASLVMYRDAITPTTTPCLYRDLEIAEELRHDLLVIINEILDHSTA